MKKIVKGRICPVRLNWLLGLILSVIFYAGCKSGEFMPPEQGSPLPYEPTQEMLLNEALQKSGSNLFRVALERSNVPEILDSIGKDRTNFTFLVLSDQALQKSGYDQQKLAAMDPKELDSLLLFYVLRSRITGEDLSGRRDNLEAVSLLRKDKLYISGGEPYYFRQHLQVRDNVLFINGRALGKAESVPIKNGYVWLLDEMLPVPDKTFLQAIEADGRFKLFLGILRHNDALYSQLTLDRTGYPSFDRNAEELRFSQRTKWELVINGQSRISFNTLFLPTDEAFRAAGFNSLEDLTAFDIRRGYPKWSDNHMDGQFPTDTLLDYHVSMGRFTTGITNGRWNMTGQFNDPVIYSNLFPDNGLLSKLAFSWATLNAPDPTFYMPLEFIKDASGKISIRVQGSEAPAAAVTGPDIPTLMGPIHALDHLLVPRGFKLDN